MAPAIPPLPWRALYRVKQRSAGSVSPHAWQLPLLLNLWLTVLAVLLALAVDLQINTSLGRFTVAVLVVLVCPLSLVWVKLAAQQYRTCQHKHSKPPPVGSTPKLASHPQSSLKCCGVLINPNSRRAVVVLCPSEKCSAACRKVVMTVVCVLVILGVLFLLLLLAGDVELNPGPGKSLHIRSLASVVYDVELNPGPVVLSLDDALKLAELYEEKWFEIGKELKLSIEVLSRIWDKFFLLSPEKKRLREMLKEWLASSANPTQDDLVAALKSFRVAGDIAIKRFVDSHNLYQRALKLPDIGVRRAKHWYLLERITRRERMLTVCAVPVHCSLNLNNFSNLYELLQELNQHPNVHPILEMTDIQDTEQRHVAVVQPYVQRGSLKDLIYGNNPAIAWDAKNEAKGKALPPRNIALYGRQILEGLLHLHQVLRGQTVAQLGLTGFDHHGHVQSGNVFVVADSDGKQVCKVGGHDNTLLGYKTRLYKLFKDYLEHLDVLMFGHLLFEMAAGYELQMTFPTEANCCEVEDAEVLEVLKFIFAIESDTLRAIHRRVQFRQQKQTPSLEEVLHLSFFQTGPVLPVEPATKVMEAPPKENAAVQQEAPKEEAAEREPPITEEAPQPPEHTQSADDGQEAGLTVEEREKLFNEAMDHGYFECRSIVVLLIGAAGSGKTSFKRLLLNEEPLPERHSTGILEDPIRIVSMNVSQRDSTSDIWKKKSPTELLELITSNSKTASASTEAPIEITPGVENTKISAPTTPKPQHQSQSGVFVRAKQKLVNFLSLRSASESETYHLAPETSDVDCDDTAIESASLSDFVFETDPAVFDHFKGEDQLRQIITERSGRESISKLDFIYLIDSGGQPQFHDMLRAFIEEISACVLVIKLNERLDNHPIVEYYQQGLPIGQPYASPYTHEEIVLNCLRTLHTEHHTTTDQSKAMKKTETFVVGTHKDKQDDCSETVKEKNERLACLLHPLNRAFYSHSDRESVFPLDCNSRLPPDVTIAADFRCIVSSHLDTMEHKKVPLQWHALELFIKEYAELTSTEVVSFKNCLQLGSAKLHMDAKKVQRAIDYLVSLNIFFRYPKIVPDAVFCSSQVILNKVTELVEHSYKLRVDVLPDSGKLVLQFKDYGFISVRFLKKFQRHYHKGLFEELDLIKILSHLLITAKFDDGATDDAEARYFMPVLLRNLTPSKVDKHRRTVTFPCALFIYYKFSKTAESTFDQGWLPSGIFPSLVVYLQNFAKWRVVVSGSGVPNCLYRNCVLFYKKGAKIALIDSREFIEVHIHIQNQDLCNVLCPQIWRDIDDGLKRAAEILHYGTLTHSMAFQCLCNSEAPTDRHFAEFYSDPLSNTWWSTCSKTFGEAMLTPGQKVWLEKAPTAAVAKVVTEEELSGLLELLKPEAANWEDLLPQLGVPFHTLDRIRSDNANKPSFSMCCFRDGLREWIVSNQSPTYQKIIDALNGAITTNKPLALEVQKVAQKL